MKCKLTKASDYEFKKEIELYTMEDLVKLMNEYEKAVIIYNHYWDDKELDQPIIVIYDDWVE